jgi:GPH family glycoside/pentoside/hexuronide:cation symporter
MPALFCKENVQLEGESQLALKDIAVNTKKFLLGIKQTATCKPFMKLCGATFLIFNGFQTIAQFAFFIILFYLFQGDKTAAGNWPAWFGTISAVATAFLVIPIITFIAQKVGKKNAFIISTVISFFGYILKWWCFNPANPWLMFLPLPLISFSIGGLFTLMMSMTADVCDLDELMHGSPRREATFGAVYWWMVKLGTACAILLSGAILKWVGFDQNITVQSVETITNLRIADICIPIITGVLAIIVIWNYDITEQKAREIRDTLNVRRQTEDIPETV